MNTMQGMPSSSDEVPESLSFDSYSLVNFFHGFPRIQLNSNQFKPDCEKYQKSVLFLMILLPLGFFLASLLKTCIVHRCVWRRKKTINDHGQNLGCLLLFSITILVIVATLSLAVGLYGNDLSHDGAAPLLSTPPRLESRNVEATKILRQERIDADQDEQAIQSFADQVDNATVAIGSREELKNLVADFRLSYNRGQASLGNLVAITGNGGGGELDPSLAESGDPSLIFLSSLRCWITSAFFLFTSLVLLLLLLGLAKRSKVCLGFFLFLSVVVVLLDWILVALHVGVAVGVSDLCTNPEEFFSSYEGDYSSKFIQKIVDCNRTLLTEDRRREMWHLKETIGAFFEADKISTAVWDKLIGTAAAPMNLREAAQSLNSLINLERKNWELLHVSSLLNCRANQRLLLQALEAVCTTGIAGIGTVMAAAILLGFFMTLLILLAGYACKTFRNNAIICKSDGNKISLGINNNGGSNNNNKSTSDSVDDDDEQPLVNGSSNHETGGVAIQEQAAYLESESAA